MWSHITHLESNCCIPYVHCSGDSGNGSDTNRAPAVSIYRALHRRISSTVDWLNTQGPYSTNSERNVSVCWKGRWNLIYMHMLNNITRTLFCALSWLSIPQSPVISSVGDLPWTKVLIWFHHFVIPRSRSNTLQATIFYLVVILSNWLKHIIERFFLYIGSYSYPQKHLVLWIILHLTLAEMFI